MILKRQIASALPPQITGLHGSDHCRHLGVILRHSKSAFPVLLGLQFQPLQAPHSSDIKAPLLVLVKGAASTIQAPILSIIQPHSERHSGTHSSIIQTLISAPFKSWSLPLQALVTSAIQALSKRHCRCSIYTLMMCFFTSERGSRATLRWIQPVPIVATITLLSERMQPVLLAAACMALLGMKQSTAEN